MTPFTDQKKSIDEIFESFTEREKQLYCLPTGGGKTAIFSFVAKRFIKEYKRKVLVIAHRDELIDQTLITLRTIGVTCESVVASKSKLQHHSDVYVAMVKTLENRIEKDPGFLKDVGLVILDEAHIDQFRYFLDLFPSAKLLPVTGTPISLKKITFFKCSVCKKEYEELGECCNFETYEYTRKFTYSEIYDHIILGSTISELIMNDRLVRDVNYEVGSCNRSEFSVDAKTGDFDTKSTDKYFGEFNVVKNYEEICFGEKTVVFNSSSKTNLKCYNDFKEAGYENVKMFDSKNSTKKERKPLLKWFKETPDAILLNVNCFTTGFDEDTIRAVILNRATLSLSLYHQMIGRGGRKCKTEYKDHFKVIDGGGNIRYFAEKYGNSGKWSDEYDWESIFYGTDEKPKPKREPLDQTKECSNCAAIISRVSLECEVCGYTENVVVKREKTISDEVAKLIDEIPLPNGKKIVDYVQRVGKEKGFAWVILQNQIVDLFLRHGVTFGTYSKTQDNGKFEASIRRIIKEPYSSIQGSDLPGTQLRTKAYIVNKVKLKLDKYYENNTRASNTTASL